MGHYRGHQGLRIADAIRAGGGGPDEVGRWYTTLGTALHVESATRGGRRRHRRVLLGAARWRTGSTTALVEAADDESHDDYIRADTELALSRTGRDVGTPILTFHPGDDEGGQFLRPGDLEGPDGRGGVDPVGRRRDARHDVGHGRAEAVEPGCARLHLSTATEQAATSGQAKETIMAGRQRSGSKGSLAFECTEVSAGCPRRGHAARDHRRRAGADRRRAPVVGVDHRDRRRPGTEPGVRVLRLARG